MKKFYFLTFALVLLIASQASAATLSFTADNEINGFTINGKSIDVSTLSNMNNLQGKTEYTFNYDPSKELTITWDVKNYPLSETTGPLNVFYYTNPQGTSPYTSTYFPYANPMGFIATLDIDGKTYDSNLTDGLWSVAADMAGKEYDYNSGAWYNKVSADFSGAEWLSTELNSWGLGSSSMTVSFNLAPTPIPGAVWLLGSGLVGLVGIRRKMHI